MEENAVRSHSFNGNKFFAFFCKYIDNQAIALYIFLDFLTAISILFSSLKFSLGSLSNHLKKHNQ